MKTITFINNAGSVEKTSLVYHTLRGCTPISA